MVLPVNACHARSGKNQQDQHEVVAASSTRLIGNSPHVRTLGKNLQAQYERWQPRAKYKMHLDPTVEDVKKLCSTCRKSAKV